MDEGFQAVTTPDLILLLDEEFCLALGGSEQAVRTSIRFETWTPTPAETERIRRYPLRTRRPPIRHSDYVKY